MAMRSRRIIIEIIGWYGALAILYAFALSNFELLSTSSAVYQLLNITGAAGVILSSYCKKDFQPVFLNTVWLLVAAVGLVKVLV